MPSSFVYAEQDMVPGRSSCGFGSLNLHLLLVLHRSINEWGCPYTSLTFSRSNATMCRHLLPHDD